MNKQRRQELSKIYDELEGLKLRLEFVSEEENEAFDNMPESISEGEKGEKMTESIEQIDNSACSIDDVLSEIVGIIER